MAVSEDRTSPLTRRALSRLGFVAFLAACVLTACSLITSYDGLEGAPKTDSASPDGPDSDVPDVLEAAVVPIDPCTSEGIPSAPDGGPLPGNVGRLTTAVRSIQFFDSDGGPPSGLNLDRTCGDSCTSSAQKPPKDPPTTGIDNAAFSFLQLLRSSGVKVDDKGFNDALKAGKWGLVLRLDGYSGTPDDDDVKLDLLNAAGVNKEDGGARLDGNDEWILDGAGIVAGVSLSRSTVAYVRGNVLVARFVRFPPTLRIAGGPGQTLVVAPELFSVTVTAKIVSYGNGGMTLTDGKLVGATAPESFLLMLQRLGLCASDQVFPTAVDFVCDVRDLAPTLTSPVTDKCTRISMAIAFDSVPATVALGPKVVNDTFGCDGGDPTKGCGTR